MRTRRPLASVALLCAVLAGSLGLSSCGSQGHHAAADAAANGPASRVQGDPATFPLTGLPVPQGQSAVKRRPVLVLKMDNTPSSSPQLGLASADLVVEELVEGGITRLAAFYYSRLPGVSGPVRSMRASDIDIVAPENPTIVTSGAARVTLGLIHKAGLHFVTEGSRGFARTSDRVAPYNLMANLTQVAAGLHVKAARPVDYLPWGTASAMPSGVRATTIAATFSGGHTTDWRYAAGHYVNENSNAPRAMQFPATTVLVLRVKEGNAGYLDPAGNPVPETKLTGTGPAMLFHGGRLVRGTWSKASATTPITLSSGGKPLTVPAGHTWIELVPAATGNVTFGRR